MTPSEFVKKVVESYRSGVGVFKRKINAEDLIPSDIDDLNKSLFTFYVLQLDYAMKSQILYTGANKLYKEISDFFTPSKILAFEQASLAKILQGYLHPRYINEAVKRYTHNSKILASKYSCDPRVLFISSTSCEEVLKRLKDFRGFGPKIGNFFVRTMINTFNYTYPDIDLMLPPVDVHDVRIAYLLGYIKTDRMSPKNINLVKDLWSKACRESGESWLVFDKALWLLGSEGKPKTKEDILTLLT